MTRPQTENWSIWRALALMAATFAIVLGSLLPYAAMAARRLHRCGWSAGHRWSTAPAFRPAAPPPWRRKAAGSRARSRTSR
ncbi:MAG: hypothetical protein EON88_10365, partial [Brevundimonas sp.]